MGMHHCMNDCSAQVLHFLFTCSFQAVSKLGKWTQCTSNHKCKITLTSWVSKLAHWVHFPNLETGWKLSVNKPWNSCALKSFLLCIMHWVGTVNRHGYVSQQKGTICDAHGPYPLIWWTLKPVFRRIWLIRCAYELLRRLHLEIWRFLCSRRQQQRWQRWYDQLLTPGLVHAHRVKISARPHGLMANQGTGSKCIILHLMGVED